VAFSGAYTFLAVPSHPCRARKVNAMDIRPPELPPLEWLSKHFNAEDLQLLCGDLHINYEDLAGATKAARIRSLLDYCLRHGREKDLVDACLKERPNVPPWNPPAPAPAPAPSPAAPDFLAFANRKNELEIPRRYAEPRHLIYAPAGYGKTRLLSELKSRFVERKWLTACVSLQQNPTLAAIAGEIARQYGIHPVLNTDKADELGRRLGVAIRDECAPRFRAAREDERAQGVALLIDIDQSPVGKLKTTDLVVNGLARGMETALGAIPEMKALHNSFRLVLAGRCVAQRYKAQFSRVHALAPLDYDAVRQTIDESPLRDRRNLDRLTAHVMFHTGGHPGCISHFLNLYNSLGMLPDPFVRQHALALWDQAVRPAIDDVCAGIDPKWLPLLEELSIFRRFDTVVLRDLIKRLRLPYRNEDNLAQELTGTHIVHWDAPDQRYLEDGITRRLLVLKQARAAPPGDLARRCEYAQSVCAARLSKPATQGPHLWAIEFMFQFLQRHIGGIATPEQRARIADRLFSQAAPEAIRRLLAVKARDGREEYRSLRARLEEDWEFRLTVNYFLRERRYNEAPYRMLLRVIEQAFS
jgi:hypothetical protein